MSKTLNYLGIARKSGNIELGEENAKALIKAGKARLVLLASDASEGVSRRVEGYVHGFHAPVIRLPFDGGALGGALGRARCAAAAIPDLGLAVALAAALAEEYDGDDSYADAAQKLAEKQAQIAARKTAKGSKKRR